MATRAPAFEHPPLARNRDFLFLWFGQGVSQIGVRVQQLALVWWALENGGTMAAVSSALVATSLPFVVAGLFAGVLADRCDRRGLMVTCESLNGAVVLVLAVLAWSGQLTFPVLILATTIVSTMGAFFSPAAMSAIPDLVRERDLMRANSLQEMTAQSAMVLGPALGGVLLAWLGVPAAFLANAVCYLVSGACLLALRLSRRAEAAPGESVWRQLLGGFDVLKESRAVATLLALFAVANFFLVPVTVFLPYYAKEVFRVGAGGLGMLEGAIGAGMIVGAVVLMRRGAVSRRRLVIQAGVAVPGLCLALMGLWERFPAFLGALFLLGAALSVLNVVSMTYFQETVPPAKLGRFMGLLMTLIMALMPLSYAAAGLATLGIEAGAVMLGSGAVLMVLGLCLPLIRALRSLDGEARHG